MSFIKGIPDPSGSPNEKLVSPPKPHDVESRIRSDLLDEGFDMDMANSLARVLRKQTDRQGLSEENVKRELEYWANRHTHPGGGDSVAYPPFDPEREYIVLYHSSGNIDIYDSYGSIIHNHNLSHSVASMAIGPQPNFTPYLLVEGEGSSDNEVMVLTLDIDDGTTSELLTLTTGNINADNSYLNVFSDGSLVATLNNTTSGDLEFYKIDPALASITDTETHTTGLRLFNGSPLIISDTALYAMISNNHSTSNDSRFIFVEFGEGITVIQQYSGIDLSNLRRSFNPDKFVVSANGFSISTEELRLISVSSGDEDTSGPYPLENQDRQWIEVPRVERLFAGTTSLNPQEGTTESLGGNIGGGGLGTIPTSPEVNPSNTRVYGWSNSDDYLRAVGVDNLGLIWETDAASGTTNWGGVVVGTLPEV